MARKKRRKTPGFLVEVEHREDGVTRVALIGDSEKEDSARDEVAGILHQLLSENRHKILFDTTRLDWLTVDVVGALVGDTLRHGDAGGAMIFAGLNEETGPLLEQLGVLNFIGNTEEVEEAAEWLHQAVGETKDVEPKRLVVKGQKDPSGVRVISLRGALGEREGKRLVKTVRAQIEKGHTKIVLDCERLIDANGLAYLVQLVQECEQADAKLVLSTVWGVPATLIEVLGLHAILPIFPDREAAIATLVD
ncbi:MAG: STAS domain-containing protein [Planctomycetes bacterium]|nr:STAS domain-containing protein [Planctomycetota bacterium]